MKTLFTRWGQTLQCVCRRQHGRPPRPNGLHACSALLYPPGARGSEREIETKTPRRKRRDRDRERQRERESETERETKMRER